MAGNEATTRECSFDIVLVVLKVESRSEPCSNEPKILLQAIETVILGVGWQAIVGEYTNPGSGLGCANHDIGREQLDRLAAVLVDQHLLQTDRIESNPIERARSATRSSSTISMMYLRFSLTHSLTHMPCTKVSWHRHWLVDARR